MRKGSQSSSSHADGNGSLVPSSNSIQRRDISILFVLNVHFYVSRVVLRSVVALPSPLQSKGL